jgi:hypothetical protein
LSVLLLTIRLSVLHKTNPIFCTGMPQLASKLVFVQ